MSAEKYLCLIEQSAMPRTTASREPKIRGAKPAGTACGITKEAIEAELAAIKPATWNREAVKE